MPREIRMDRLPATSASRVVIGLLLVVLSTFIWATEPAKATVAFNTNAYSPEVWVSEHEDGTEPKDLGRGLVVQVSPDGRWLAYQRGSQFNGWQLVVYDVATGRRFFPLAHMDRVGQNQLGETTAFAWSPDSTKVAVLQKEKGTGKETLYVVGVEAGGGKARIATGHFRGVSFSPDGTQVVFGLAHEDGLLPKTDIARAAASGGPLTFLTHDHISGWPLWGPGGQIAFSKRTKAERYDVEGETWAREAFDLYVMDENGGEVKRMTRVGYEAGVVPGFWLPSGDQLVANFQSLEKNYAALVTPALSAVKPLNPPISGQGLAGFNAGFAGVGLSADGQSVLGCRGTVVDAIQPMASIPLVGGKSTLINKSYWSPSWSGLSTVGTSPC